MQRRGLHAYRLEVGYSSTDPQKAQRVLSAVAEAYLEDQRTQRAATSAADASGWLDRRADELHHRLERSERAVGDYAKSSNSMVNVAPGDELIYGQIEDIAQQIALARSRKAEAQGRLEQVKDVTRQPEHTLGLVELLQSPVVARLRTQYAEVARQEADFRAIYGDRNPSIVAIARRQPICAAKSNARSPASSMGSGTTIRSRRAARPRSRWSSRPCGRAPIRRPKPTSG